MSIQVTKSFLPPLQEYQDFLTQIWESNWLTNHGPLSLKLEKNLKDHLGLSHLQYVSNGTVALQLALKVLKIKGEVITTPFSYVATTNAILWENCTPVFVDIDPDTLCIDPQKIEEKITEKTMAIMPTHVFGIPCDVDKIGEIASRHNLKVIYDAAHAFGVNINGESVLKHGDISTLSFHATKVFHTVEGGAVVAENDEIDELIFRAKAFGHVGNEYFGVGINGKNSELHAAMGLCNLKYADQVKKARAHTCQIYREALGNSNLNFVQPPDNVDYNHAYCPVLFEDENQLLKVFDALADEAVYPRRYFYPSLNRLPFHLGEDCPVSQNVSPRVACLPLSHDLPEGDVQRISYHILKALRG